MRDGDTPVIKDLVMVGGGHSHVAVLKRFGMKPIPGVRLTLICREAHTPYSGMLPGLIAGYYGFDDAHIDLEPLARFAGARFYHDEVTRLDPENRTVICHGRPPVAYDLLSINIGSFPGTAETPGAERAVVPVKPISGFVAHWERLTERVVARSGERRIGVVGGGAGGVELILAVQHRLRRLLAEHDRPSDVLEFHLVTEEPDILTGHNRHAAARLRRTLEARGVQLHLGFRVSEVADGAVRNDTGEAIALNEILWVTRAAAAPWVRASGLEVDERGFVRVDETLRSISHAAVFAAGDIASVVGQPRPKSGVFAVRQGLPLARNLARALLGRPTRPYRMQRDFLSLIGTGDGRAVASRGRWAAEGRLLWLLKDRIDRRFMRKYADLPEMDEATAPDVPKGLADAEARAALAAVPMRCGGCGAKVGATMLSRVLDRLEVVERDDVLIGLRAPDDAAVVAVPSDKVSIQTVDGFRAMIDDPYLFGRIAANHCLGDVFAMGGTPQTALAIATVPFGIEEKVEQTLTEMMLGATEVLKESGTALVGGHTSEGAELSLGFAINGLIDRERILRKAGMRSGDVLVLTKAIGTGTLFAADMRARAKGRWIAAAVDSMLQSNREAAACLIAHGATACTDVTGFGLLGHLVEMAKPSGVGVELDLSALPVLDGALESIAAGILSSLQPENLRLRRSIANLDDAAGHPRFPLLFDPQTAGGLVASVPAARAEPCLAALRRLGYGRAAIVGRVGLPGIPGSEVRIVS